ncbi:MAG: SPOR domain-containing protein [Pseudoxanthomonas sp.]
MDTALKQRLIGAVVLVALAVIFLPMLIKGPAPDSGVSDVPLDVPTAPGGQYETRELPLVTPGNAPAGGVVGLESAATAPATPTSSEAVPLGAPAADAMLPPSAAGGNYAVNFGAYATPADADAVIARLKQASLPAFREPATINGKPAFRVRIGPYAERADAEAVRLQAGRIRSDVKAQVVTLDAPTAPAAASASTSQPLATAAPPPVTTQALPREPAKPAQTAPAVAKPPATVPTTPSAAPQATAPAIKPVDAPKPAASNVGFAVQLGAFSKAADANALRDKLRAGGFSAFVEQVNTDKGTLNRVRVGPVANRADADQLKAQVAAKVGINGMVRPHP